MRHYIAQCTAKATFNHFNILNNKFTHYIQSYIFIHTSIHRPASIPQRRLLQFCKKHK